MTGRAEYKVDGGKLLRADVTYGETVEAVELHGDFFVYPPEAKAAVEDAIVGLPRDADRETVAGAVRDAVPAHAELVGFAPEHVARVVAEAVDDG
ncbi:MAG: biotin--protein ligase [Candidatus Nanohaloarchaea archaeon]